ncbi:MAG: transcription antitermination factor NusB [Synergistaceae bacterium]|nr:transcription antitermination factor NusB [Synergistaceae bacterium]
MSKKRGGGKKFEARRRARELAVQFLYSLETWPPRDEGVALEWFLGEGSVAEAETPEVKDYCRFLVRGAWDRRGEIDERLLRLVTGWRPERMVSVDRAVLRVMIFEGFLTRNLPWKSAISEAVNLAHTFGTGESARFVNGVLARVAREAQSQDAQPQETQSQEAQPQE